MFFLAGLEILM